MGVIFNNTISNLDVNVKIDKFDQALVISKLGALDAHRQNAESTN